MKLSILISLLTVVFFITTCRKKAETLYISGAIIGGNNEVVKDVKVKLYSQKVENNTWSAAYSLLESITNDSDGNFSFIIEDFAFINFKIEISKDNYYSEYLEFTKEDFNDNNYFKTFNFYPFSYLQIHVKNTNPVNIEDNMSYKLLSEMPSVYQCCTNSSTYFNGYSVDSTKTCKVYGNYNIPIKWSTFKANILKEYTDTIYTLANDTTYYNLFY